MSNPHMYNNPGLNQLAGGTHQGASLGAGAAGAATNTLPTNAGISQQQQQAPPLGAHPSAHPGPNPSTGLTNGAMGSSGSSSLPGSSAQYSPPISNGMMMNYNNGAGSNNTNVSPTFTNLNYDSLGSSVSTVSSMSSSYSFHNPRLRYYLSKSFDIEDDMEFCPEIPDWNNGTSPSTKKFNPYTASVFSPGSTGVSMNNDQISPITNPPHSPRVNTPRIRKPIEIINPQTKMRVGSPAIPK